MLTQVQTAVGRIAAGIADVPHTVAGVQRVRTIVLSEERETQGEVDEMRPSDGVGLIGDELIVKTIVATIGEQRCDTLALGIESTDIKTHTLVQQAADAVALQHAGDGRIADVVGDMMNEVRLSWQEPIGDVGLLAVPARLIGHVGLKEAFIAQLLAKVATRELCLQCVEDDGSLANGAECAVDPS